MLIQFSFVIIIQSLVSAFTCPDNGLWRDPSDCSAYYQCWNGRSAKHKCPPGLMFSKQSCDWPKNVNCGVPAPSPDGPPAPAPDGPPAPAPDGLPAPAPDGPPSSPSCSDQTSTEPITAAVRAVRKKTCTRDNSIVEAVSPGIKSNPSNVCLVESIFPESSFRSFFPNAAPQYTYKTFLQAIAKFPGVCSGSEAICRKTLATMFAHFHQETADLKYIREINKGTYCSCEWGSENWACKAFPCSSRYYGRGAKQLSWNYNYAWFSKAMYGAGDLRLLKNPEPVADTWLNFASAMWFFVTPQPPKPSMLEVIDDSWQPSMADKQGGRVPGLGVTTLIINGAQECGAWPRNKAAAGNRARAYQKLASKLGVNINGEKLDCKDIKPFTDSSRMAPMYWAPGTCILTTSQTPYMTTVEGEWSACKRG